MEPTETSDLIVKLRHSKIQAMILLLTKKLGDANPYGVYFNMLHMMDSANLLNLEEGLHELLYSPPNRN